MITSHEIVYAVPNGTRIEVRYRFIDDGGSDYVMDRRVLQGTDLDAYAVSIYTAIDDTLARREVSQSMALVRNEQPPTDTAEFQPQADYDRRVLGRCMTLDDASQFFAAYPFFQAVELRGGANDAARAAYLGVPTSEWQAIATRFNNVNGVSWFLTDEKEQTWDKLPGEYL